MSLDLYQDETREKLATMPPVSTPEAGLFDNFLRGTGLATMRGFAQFGSGIDIAGGALASIQDKVMGTGTEAQTRYFKEHDDVFGSAVDYWTPRPNEVGAASEVVGGLLSTLPLVILSPGAAVASTQLSTAEELSKKNVSAEKAQAVGAVQAAGLGIGIWMPILGQNGWQRVFVGGAGYNAAQGVVMRGASAQILDGTPAADEFKAFDGKALTLDVLMGMAFGSLAHLSPSQRQQGAQYWDRLTKWAEDLSPSQVDSIAALRQSQHMNVDSVPGKLEGVTDIEAHTQRVKAAIDQLSKGEPVAVDNLRAPAFEADARRTAAAEKQMAGLEKTAEQIRDEEGIAPLPQETGAPAGQPRGAEPPPPRGSSEGKPAGAEAIPYDEISASNLKPKSRDKLVELYKQATVIKPQFDKGIEEIAATVGGEAQIVGLKGINRTLKKIESDYSGDPSKIKDLLRATIMVDGADSAKMAIDEIGKRYKIVGEPRNLLDPSIEPIDGYRDAKFNVEVNGHIAEIQVNLPEMLQAKKAAHPLYAEREALARRKNDEGRDYTPSEQKRVDALNDSMKKIYEPVLEEIKARNSFSDTGLPLRRADSGSNLRGGEVSQAAQKSPGTPAFIDTGIPSTSKNSPSGENLKPAGSATAASEARSIADTSSGILAEKGVSGEGPTPLQMEAERIALEQPDLRVAVGKDAEGNQVTQSAREFLDQAAGEAAKIRQQAKLLAIAAQCMLGVG